MTSATEILDHIIEETNAARAHYQTWWALRNLALPDFYDTMNDDSYVQFFHASNAGHYKLIFVAIGKIYDSDTRSAGIRELKSALRAERHGAIADKLEADLAAATTQVSRILTIRNRSVLHNEHSISRKQVYELGGGITANEIRDAIDSTTNAINAVATALGHSSRVSVGKAHEEATLTMLERLRRGGT
jgi:hypothetical protein